MEFNKVNRHNVRLNNILRQFGNSSIVPIKTTTIKSVECGDTFGIDHGVLSYNINNDKDGSELLDHEDYKFIKIDPQTVTTCEFQNISNSCYFVNNTNVRSLELRSEVRSGDSLRYTICNDGTQLYMMILYNPKAVDSIDGLRNCSELRANVVDYRYAICKADQFMVGRIIPLNSCPGFVKMIDKVTHKMMHNGKRVNIEFKVGEMFTSRLFHYNTIPYCLTPYGAYFQLGRPPHNHTGLWKVYGFDGTLLELHQYLNGTVVRRLEYSWDKTNNHKVFIKPNPNHRPMDGLALYREI